MPRFLAVPLVVAALASPAYADATAFIGSTSTPTTRPAKGFAVGAGMLIIGFEAEYSDTSEEPLDAAPSLRTGMGNVLLQSPIAIKGIQPYYTIGGGFYRETLNDVTETHVGINTGGGVKVSLIGPLRARLDYRVFKLRGEPLHDVVHRFYAGLNLKF